MITYRDKSFCARKGCPVTKCDRNSCHVPWASLPGSMGVALGDFYGKYEICPEKPPKLPEWAQTKEGLTADKVMQGLEACMREGNCHKCPYNNENGCIDELSSDAFKRITQLEAKLTVVSPVTRCDNCDHFIEYSDAYGAMSGFDGACGVYMGHTTGDRAGRMKTDFCSQAKPLKGLL